MFNLFEGVFDYKKQMAENLKEAIDIFKNIGKNKHFFYDNFVILCCYFVKKIWKRARI